MTNDNINTGSCPANAATQQFLSQCDAVTEIRDVGGRFEFDYDATVEVSYVPESLEIEW